MSIQDPGQHHQAFQDAFNRGDIEALLALYAPDAIVVSEPGHEVSGKAGIRAFLEELLSMERTATIETRSVVVVGDIALTRGKWALRGTGADGQPLEMGGDNAEVSRRQPDGTWLSIIDNPWA